MDARIEQALTITPSSSNLLAHPEFTFHLKNGVQADLAARADSVLGPVELRRIFAPIIDDLNQARHGAYIANRPIRSTSRARGRR